MRDTEAGGPTLQKPSRMLIRALRLSAVVLGIGLVMSAGVARAQDEDEEEDDGRSFEQKIIGTIISGIGGTSMDSHGIDYRERSPLVVPPKIDLPKPETASRKVKDANWPKDPDEARRKALIEARKNEVVDTRPYRLLTPDELNVGRTAAPVRTNNDPIQPGVSNPNPILSPSQLGFNGGLSDLFGHKAESAQFKGEPTRESLTQPPAGYQTPSPNYAYGSGPTESLNKDQPAAQNQKYDGH